MTRWVWIKAVLGGAGLVVGLTGMVMEYRPFVWVAIAALGLAFLVRFLERSHRTPPPDPRPDATEAP
jgi:hypothetical protein